MQSLGPPGWLRLARIERLIEGPGRSADQGNGLSLYEGKHNRSSGVERKSERSIVPEKPGNSGGGKGPYQRESYC